MAPHGVYRCLGDDSWLAISCRDDHDWRSLKTLVSSDLEQASDRKRKQLDERFDELEGRLEHRAPLEKLMAHWCADRSRWELAEQLASVGVPAAPVQSPAERIDGDAATGGRSLWPMVDHPAMGGVRVDGQPVQFSKTPWAINRSAPTLGQHNQYVIGELLGRSADEIERLEDMGVI